WALEPLIDETAALVQAALALVARSATLRKASFREVYREALGLDPMTAPVAELQAVFPGEVDAAGLTRDDWLDLLMTHCIQPAFPAGQLLAMYDYPATQCALAKVVRRGGVDVAERFELYLGPLELANGYHELLDAEEQRARFERDHVVRTRR